MLVSTRLVSCICVPVCLRVSKAWTEIYPSTSTTHPTTTSTPTTTTGEGHPLVEVDVQHGVLLPAAQHQRLLQPLDAQAVHPPAPVAEGLPQQLVQGLHQLPVGQTHLLAAARLRHEVGTLHQLGEGEVRGEEKEEDEGEDLRPGHTTLDSVLSDSVTTETPRAFTVLRRDVGDATQFAARSILCVDC